MPRNSATPSWSEHCRLHPMRCQSCWLPTPALAGPPRLLLLQLCNRVAAKLHLNMWQPRLAVLQLGWCQHVRTAHGRGEALPSEGPGDELRMAFKSSSSSLHTSDHPGEGASRLRQKMITRGIAHEGLACPKASMESREGLSKCSPI